MRALIIVTLFAMALNCTITWAKTCDQGCDVDEKCLSICVPKMSDFKRERQGVMKRFLGGLCHADSWCQEFSTCVHGWGTCW